MKSSVPKFLLQSLALSCFFMGLVFADNSLFKTKSSPKFHIKMDTFQASMTGKVSTEYFGAQNLSYLNRDIVNDCSSYFRSTVDYNVDMAHGFAEHPRIVFHDTFRFRYKWGSETEAKMLDTFTKVGDVNLPVKGKHLNKHLIWSREAWTKIALGNLDYPNKNMLQVGLIPFEVGRGISLGSAYTVDGFLGFSPGDSIEQYAPAILLSLNPVVETYTLDCYVAFLENHNKSIRSNNALVRLGEIGACPQRGVGRDSYIYALRNMIKILNGIKEKLSVEPYVVVQTGLDQDLEFSNDADSFLTTFGIAVEGVHGRFNYGFETALNIGEHNIKPWDRNLITLVNNNGTLSEQYTKIYSADPSSTLNPSLAYVTTANITAVKAADQNPAQNGKRIGTGTIIAPDATVFPSSQIITMTSTPLFNAFDRFRPEQKQHLSGYFMMADGTYEIIDKVLSSSLGIGYASGYIDQQRDTNKMTSEQLLHQNFTGFIPLQSVYSGKRISQLIIFNKGIPRFNVRNPGLNTTNMNLTPVLQSDSINEVTNIAFFGGNIDWKIEKWKKYKLNIVPNVIGYWSPKTSSYVIKAATKSTVTGADTSPAQTAFSDNFLGTECTTKISATIYEHVNIYGYLGFFLPGQHYRDMRGALINKLPIGSNPGYICDLGMSYSF